MSREVEKGKQGGAGNIATKLRPYLDIALKSGVDDAVIIETATVITAPWVRLKCRFGCGGYSGCLCCPPFSPAPEDMRKVLDSYKYAILLHRHIKREWQSVGKLSKAAITLERSLFLAGYYKAWATKSGPCTLCPECDTSQTCKHPDKARPSMEACGIDVYATARGNGLPINVVKTRADERDFYALVLVK